MRYRWGGLAGLAIALAIVTSSSAQGLGPSVSISIVEPRAQENWGYAPAKRSIRPGTWVTWSNAGQDAHTVTALDGSFDSGNLDPSEGFAWYFDQAGTWQYTCTLHPWMVGTIVVGDGQPPPSDQDQTSSADSA